VRRAGLDDRLRDRLGRGRRWRRLGLGRDGDGSRLGLLPLGLAAEPLGVGEAPDAVRQRIVDARGVALDADLQSLAEVEHHLVLDPELPRQLVDPDLLRGQARP
jgi:hypothetical protein